VLSARIRPQFQLPRLASVRLVWGVFRPVALAGLATALLFASVDRSQPWSLASALLGIALLGAVITRQMGEILALDALLGTRMGQLEMVGEIIESLNADASVGGTLATALDRLLPAMGADAGAIWLPAADESGTLTLVEQRHLPSPEAEEELAASLAVRLEGTADAALRFAAPLPGLAEPVGCLLVRIGRGTDGGMLLLARRQGEFDELDGTIVGAVGNDIGGALRSVRMISEARRLADRDPVTALYNHRSAHRRLQVELEKAEANGGSLAVLMMDLDNFKLFNDTYGHPAGDEVLKRVGDILRRVCRGADVVARYGGDEFLMLLPETNVKQAVKCAERIQASLARERFRCEDSCPIPIGLSYGIAAYPEDAREAQGLVAAADANLYQSKAKGGNQITARGASAVDSALVYVKGFDLFRAMVQAIDNKDGYTRRHSEEVTEYSLLIARAMGLDERFHQTLQIAGILHDVGKIGVPDAVLRKPGKLTPEEYDAMKQHPVFGALIVGALPGMEEVVLGVKYHHERWDGRGYPEGLAGEDIPLIGRIMAVADAFSAMTTSRPYRKAMTERGALNEVRCGLGTQFDPQIGALFVRLREERLTRLAQRPRRRARRAAPPEGLLADPTMQAVITELRAPPAAAAAPTEH